MSKPLSAAGLARLHSFLGRAEVPGLVTVVARGEDADIFTAGVQTTGGAPMARDTIFRLSSMTKPITAAVAMVLVEECRLRLDDPVDELLPELANRKVLVTERGPLDDVVPAKRSITLRDLLTFRSGYGLVMAQTEKVPWLRAMRDAGIEQGPPRPDAMLAPDAWMKAIGAIPLLHQPGERWTYHWSADILGVLVARASGQALGDFMAERIFAPLGMNDTAFWVPANKLPRFATQYSGGSVYDPPDGEWSHPPAFPSGGAGLVSTADDLLAFSRMMLGGGADVLSRASVTLMTSNHLTPEQRAVSGLFPGDFDHLGFGFGMSVQLDRNDLAYSPGTFGWAGGLGSTWYTDPVENVTTILLTQVAYTSPEGPQLAKDFATLAYTALD